MSRTEGEKSRCHLWLRIDSSSQLGTVKSRSEPQPVCSIPYPVNGGGRISLLSLVQEISRKSIPFGSTGRNPTITGSLFRLTKYTPLTQRFTPIAMLFFKQA